MNEAARFYAWAQLRSAWRPRLALVVLLGAVGAVAIGSAAGASRTNSAVDRFLDAQRAFDVLVFCGPPERDGDEYVCEQELRAVDEIEDTTAILTLEGLLSVSGQNIEPYDDTCWSGAGDVRLIVAPDGRFGTAINTQRFIAGRPADPSRPAEVVISRDLARRTGVDLGDTIDVQLFAGADCLDDPERWRPARSLTVVGIEVSPFEVRPESGDYLSLVHGTPALLAEVGDLPDSGLFVVGRLRSGHTFEDLQAPLDRLGISSQPGEGTRFAVPQSLNADNLRRSVRPFTVAQWLVSVLTAAAGLVLFGQMLNRQIRGAAAEFRGLGHLGLTRRDLSAVGLAHVVSVVIPASLLAAVGGYLGSAFTPLGIARVVEVHRGLRADVTVLGLGTVLMALGLVCIAIPSVLVTARQRTQETGPPSGRAGVLARQLGGGPVSTTGLRMAFEPLRGPTAPPLRTGFGMMLAAVVLLVGATVFAGSLTHLLESNRLIGWNWDALLYVEGEGAEPVTADRFGEVVAETPGVAEVTAGTIFPPLQLLIGPERTELQIVSFDDGPIGPTMISGRAPAGADEIVLGRETLSRLGYEEGDRVPYVAVTGDFEEVIQGGGTEVPGQVTIVGTGVFPASGGDSRLGTGGAVDFDFFSALLPDAEPDGAFVRLEAGARLDEVTASIADALAVDEVGGITADVLGPQLLDLGQVRDLPIALAAMLALLAVGVVAQVIVGSTHARRGELGVLRALGMRPRQIRGAILVQAVAVGGSVLIVGIPVGIVFGRAAWQAFALSLGTKPEVDVAITWLGVLVVGLLVLASLLGLIGSARPRRQLAAALRRE